MLTLLLSAAVLQAGPSDDAQLRESLLWLINSESRLTSLSGQNAIENQGPAVVPQLRQLLRDPDPSIRYGAISALALFPDEAAQDLRPIIGALDDSSEKVVVGALDFLNRLENPGAKAVREAAKLLERPRWRYHWSQVFPRLMDLFLSQWKLLPNARAQLQRCEADRRAPTDMREVCRSNRESIEFKMKYEATGG